MSVLPIAHVIHPVVDPARNTRGVENYVHEIGASWSDYMTTPQESAANNTNSTFNIRFSDKKSAIDPSSVVVEMPIVITKAAGLALDTFNPRAEGFASRPLEKIARNFKISHDGISYSYDLSKIIYAMECLDEIKVQQDEINDGLKMIDMCQQYSDLWGTNASPYALPQDNTAQANRSTHPITSTYNPITDVSTFTSMLHLNLGDYSPFCKQQLYPLSSDTVTLSFDWESGHLPKMWRVDAANVVGANAVYTFTLGQARLKYKLNQLPLGLVSPIHETYKYNRVIARTQATSPVIPSGASATLSSGTYELSRVPKKMIVYLKKAEADFTTPALDMQTADFFAEITGQSMSFGNRTNVFNTASQYDMFELSKRRGLNSDFSFSQFVGHQSNEVAGAGTGKGSLLVFEPIIDVCASGGELLTNGIAMKNVVQMNITFRNNNALPHRFDLNVIEIYDGVIEVNNNLAQIYENITSSAVDVVNSKKVEFPVDELRGGSLGSFFSGLLSKGKKLFDVVMPVLKSTRVLSTGASMIPQTRPLAPFLAQLGLGEDGESMEGGVSAGRRRMNKKKN